MYPTFAGKSDSNAADNDTSIDTDSENVDFAGKSGGNAAFKDAARRMIFSADLL